MVWVLETAYEFKKASIISALEHIKSHPVFILQNTDSFNIALENYKNNSADFSDYLILAESNINKCQLITFDKKLGKAIGVQQLKSS